MFSLVSLLAVSAVPAFPQSCPTINANDRDQMWKAGQEMHVYLDPNDPFLAGCRGSLQSAMDNWQYSYANASWGVAFSFTTDSRASNLLSVYHRTPQAGRCANSADVEGCFSAQYDLWPYDNGGPGMVGGSIELSLNHTDCNALAQTFAHELGHGFGLDDCRNCSGTIMGDAPTDAQGHVVYDPRLGLGPTSCDMTSVHQNTDTMIEEDNCQRQVRACGPGQVWDVAACGCVDNPPFEGDPVVIDLAGNGIALTSFAAGVGFDLRANGTKPRIAWTARGSDDAWLAIDRNGNGRIDDGRELFSDVAPQKPSSEPNGFLALAMLDDPANGGNGDGRIDAADRGFARLLLWQDRNHDGVSQPEELSSLAASGVQAIELQYRFTGRRDRNGNYLRYRAKIVTAKPSSVSRWAFDAFLRVAE
jgi:hypothetical protein